MAHIAVKTNSLFAASSEFDRIAQEINSIASEARGVMNGLGSTLSSRVASSYKRAAIFSQLQASSNDARELAKVLDTAVNFYTIAENKVASRKFGSGTVNAQASVSSTGTDRGKGLSDSLRELLSDSSVLGNVVSAFAAASAMRKNRHWTDVVKNALQSAKAFNKSIFDIDDAYFKIKRYANFKPGAGKLTTLWGKKLLGLEDYFKVNKLGNISKAKNLSTKWYNNWKKTISGQFDDALKGTAIAGVVLSGIVSGISNYQEYLKGEISGVRAGVETVTETVIDTASTAALTAAVAATVATVAGGAPVLVVAAGTWIIKSGADWLTSTLSDGKFNSFTEFASDTIIDGSIALYNGAKEVYKGVCDTAVNCYNSVKNGVKTLWNKIF